MIYKTISSKAIINKVFRDLGPAMTLNADILIDMIEWIGEALEGIGSTGQLTDKQEVLEVKNGRVAIPCDLYLIKQVAYDNRPLRYSSSSFNYTIHCDGCVNERAYTDMHVQKSYYVDPGYIHTDVEDGDSICLMYMAFPTDEDGFPQVPDNYSYREAIFWFIVMKMMMRGVKVHAPITFADANNQWLRYCSQAEAAGKLFDIPRAEAFMNQWLRMAPNIRRYESFFTELSTPESIQRQYRPIW